MNRLCIFLVLLFLPVTLMADMVRFTSTPVDMFIGESKVFEEKNVKRVAIGAGDLITVKELEDDRLLIMADKAGSTTVHIWYENEAWAPRAYNIRISDEDPETRVRPEKMIRFNVKLIEFRKSALKQLGIDWSKNINGPSGALAARFVNSNLVSAPVPSGFSGLPNRINGLQGSFGWASTVTSRINFLASNGNASTIAEPILMCLNGGEADFHAGGELPLPVKDEDGVLTIAFKPYGIRLSVKPRVNEAGIIDVVIATEVSEIDNAVSVQNIPGIITRNTTTRVQVKTGETIVLAGLLSERLTTDDSSIPGLGDVPVIGNAFKNSQGQHQTTELVMFLQPQVLSREDDRAPLEEESGFLSNELHLSRWRSKLKINMVD